MRTSALALFIFGALAGDVTSALAQDHTYVARIATPVKAGGKVKASGIIWTCAKATCRAATETPLPRLLDCQALAAVVGRITLFAVNKRRLSAADLAVCARSADSEKLPTKKRQASSTLESGVKKPLVSASQKPAPGKSKTVKPSTPASVTIRTAALVLQGSAKPASGASEVVAPVTIAAPALVLEGKLAAAIESERTFSPVTIPTSALVLEGSP